MYAVLKVADGYYSGTSIIRTPVIQALDYPDKRITVCCEYHGIAHVPQKYFLYPYNFNYPDTYPDTRGQRGPDNQGSTVACTIKAHIFSI